MSPVTRSVAKRNGIIKNIQELNDFVYFPDAMSNVHTDTQYQSMFYEQLFTYDFSCWPHTCILRPKWKTMDFEIFVRTLQLNRIMSYYYREQNPTKTVLFLFSILVQKTRKSEMVFTFPVCVHVPALYDFDFTTLENTIIHGCNETVTSLFKNNNKYKTLGIVDTYITQYPPPN